MVYYPLSTLVLSGVRDILIITTAHEQESFQRLLGDGSKFGVRLSYVVQNAPRGLAQAFTLGADFIGNQPVALVLGDNIFHGSELGRHLDRFAARHGASIFGYWVRDPSHYGVVEIDGTGRVLSLEEKPSRPRSHLAIPGLYFCDNDVVEIAHQLQPSARGEYEIIDVLRAYLEAGSLSAQVLARGTAWLDTGTFDSLNDASNFVRTLQARQGLQIGCPEEAAWTMGYLSDEDLRERAEPLLASGYGKYLLELIEQVPQQRAVRTEPAPA